MADESDGGGEPTVKSPPRRLATESYLKDLKTQMHISRKWLPVIILALLLTVAALAFGVTSYVVEGQDVNKIYNEFNGVYPAVNAASTSAVLGRLALRTMSDYGVTDIDGVTIGPGDRVLLKNELNPQMNGIYVNQDGVFVRSKDMSHDYQIVPGISIYVLSGQENGGASFMLFQLTSGSSLDPVTGYGLEFKNSTAVALGSVNAPVPEDGFLLIYDASNPTSVAWSDPRMKPSSVRANPSTATAFPADLEMGPNTVLTATVAGLKVLAPPVAVGYFLGFNGTDLEWMPESGGGTVVSVGAGTGLQATPVNPIVAGGVISMADMTPFSVKVADNITNAPTDLALTRGGLLTRNAGGLTNLVRGAAGTFLSNDGADLQWSTAVTSISEDSATSGVTLNPNPIVGTGTVRLSDMPAYSVKVNATGLPAAPTDLALNEGELLTRGAGGLEGLIPGVAGEVLTSAGPGNPLVWTANGSGTVTSITAGSGLTATPPGPITSSGTISLQSEAKDSVLLTTAAGVPSAYPLAVGELLGNQATGSVMRVTAGNAGEVLTSAGAGLPVFWSPNGTGTVTSISAANASIVLTPDPIVSTGTVSVASIGALSVFVNNTALPAAPSSGVALAQGELLTNTGVALAALPAVGTLTKPEVLLSYGPGQNLAWGLLPLVFKLAQETTANVGPVEAPALAWTIRSLNTLYNPEGTADVVLANPTFTLSPGRWILHATAEAQRCGQHMIRLFNTGAGTVDSWGLSATCRDNNQDILTSVTTLDYVVTLGAATTYRIEHRVSSVTAGQSLFGVAVGAGFNVLPASAAFRNTYVSVTLTKVG